MRWEARDQQSQRSTDVESHGRVHNIAQNVAQPPVSSMIAWRPSENRGSAPGGKIAVRKAMTHVEKMKTPAILIPKMFRNV
jgi:hypothetical protein